MTQRQIDDVVAGLKALDRYTLQVKTAEPRPRLVESIFAGNDLYGAVAREVVEFYGDRIAEHPVGTGPFMLTAWRRSSQMVLERNPLFHGEPYPADGEPGDAAAGRDPVAGIVQAPRRVDRSRARARDPVHRGAPRGRDGAGAGGVADSQLQPRHFRRPAHR